MTSASSAPIVVVRLLGGLGNQMFQYATGRAFALRHGADVVLDVSSFESYTLRRYELDSLQIEARLASADELKAIGGAEPTAWHARLLAPLRGRPAIQVLREAHFHFDPALESARPPIALHGYWQSERYFLDARDRLSRELVPRQPLDPRNASTADKIRATNAVSLHVRRGDYVSDARTNRYHGTCSPEYYSAAVDYIVARVPEPHLFVFSDDPAWTSQNMTFPAPTTYVAANPADEGFRDMQLMAMCRHHVIANSSFSWWGAWLNRAPDKIVVAPARWFASSDNDTRDLVPATWVRI